MWSLHQKTLWNSLKALLNYNKISVKKALYLCETPMTHKIYITIKGNYITQSNKREQTFTSTSSNINRKKKVSKRVKLPISSCLFFPRVFVSFLLDDSQIEEIEKKKLFFDIRNFLCVFFWSKLFLTVRKKAIYCK